MQRIPWQPPDPPADVAIVEDNEGIVVRVGVSINAINAARIRAAILAAWEKRGNPGRLVLDLGKVNHIDSSGVGILLELAARASRIEVPFFVCGLQDSPHRLLDRTGLSRLFDIRENVDEALRPTSGPSLAA
jgi:anti-anti-sigma factor